MESVRFLLVGFGIQQSFAVESGILGLESGIQVPLTVNPESSTRNPESCKIVLWIPEFWVLESGIPLKESGIPLTIGIRNPSSND